MSRNSESGYSSDENTISPQEQIAQDQRRFAKKYDVEDEMMRSANGILYTGREISTEEPVVIKQIPRGKISEFKQVQNRHVPSEIYYHFKAAQASDYVVAPLDWYERRSSFVLVMERLDGFVDLFEFSKQHGAINEEAVRIIAGQLITCCMELSRAGICHRDIKDENILINPETLEIRLIDFKNLFDRPGFFRFHFKAVDQEFGMVKEEVSSSNTNSSQTEYTAAILYCWNVVSIRAIRGYTQPNG